MGPNGIARAINARWISREFSELRIRRGGPIAEDWRARFAVNKNHKINDVGPRRVALSGNRLAHDLGNHLTRCEPVPSNARVAAETIEQEHRRIAGIVGALQLPTELLLQRRKQRATYLL